jgi:hypothetical protein
VSHQYSRQRGEGEPPEAWLMQLLSGFMVTQYIHVAAKLRLADLLKDGPRTAEELADKCDADARALHRLMRALASLGIFAETAGGRFEMTDLAVPLRTDTESSLNAIARMYGEDWFWRPYGELFHSVTKGRSAFEHVFDQGFYDHVASRPEAARIFNDAMTGFTAPQARRLVAEYDFGRFGRIMDVGGGQGTLIMEVLRAYPQVRGVLFDRSEVVRAAAERLAHVEAADRLELAFGDFMAEVPSGCDAIVLRNVLQDWGDEEAQKLLTNCKRAMSREGTLLIIGRLIEPGNDPYPGKFTDLTMMVLTGGRERTLDEHSELFARAGFALGAVTRTSALCAIIEGRPL